MQPTNGIPARRFWTAVALLVVMPVLALLAGCNGGASISDSSALAPDARAGASAPLAAPNRADVARAAAPFVDAATPGKAGYRIGPQDVLDITVFMVPDLTKSVQVSERGTVNLPLVGDINASGNTAADVERQLQARLGARFLKNPQVTVFVKEYNSQRVTIEGSVKKPGVYPLRGDDTLMRSIAKAEGLDRETASSNVVVFRMTDGARRALRYDISAIRDGSMEDPQIIAGDVVVVDDSVGKTAFSIFVKLLPLATTAAILLP